MSMISEKVEAIVDTTRYHFSDTPMPCCSAEVFKTMKKLRLLDVKGKFTVSEPEYFPEDLIWLCWYLYPFESLRIKGGMTKLVGLEMQSGHMKQLQIEEKVILPNLKFMDLSFSCSITSFPDISGVPNLERLNLSFCSELVEVHQSVLLHERIIHLYLSDCDSLRSLPSSIYMKSLQTLHLNGCISLEKFPEVSSEMGCLLVLNIDGCERIRELPSSLELLTGLIILTMGKYSDMELEQIEKYKQPNVYAFLSGSLRVVDFKRNRHSEKHFFTYLCTARSSLEKLDLSYNDGLYLRFLGLSEFSHLKYLNLSCCINFTSIYELPPLIQVLKADYCRSLEVIEGLFDKYKWLFKISLISCHDIQGLSVQCMSSSELLVLKCAIVNHQLSVTVPEENYIIPSPSDFVPRRGPYYTQKENYIPKWFNNRRVGDKIPLNLPQTQITEMIGLAMCCRLHPQFYKKMKTYLRVIFESTVEEKIIFVQPTSTETSFGHLWIGYIPMDFLQKLCGGFDFEDLVITFSSSYEIRECGVHVVYKDDIKLMTRLESWIPDHMEFGWTDHDGVCREDLQRGKWSKPSFLCDTEEPNIKYIRL
ncbi:Leucine-rich repeat-containing protein [Artemisia annua]|uniref:Leucine-rich repeat-containing protein n=1 Tax=Artemisia annua TaxID=35608 RepID=A0A2U1LM98_ARTAN|nr:Leucine-rich repeat-containing protein [Artemisia annua]